MPHDFVIVGAGSAGAVLAARLTEDSDCSVLLLEAGPDYPRRADLPSDLLDSRNLAGMAHDWNYSALAVPGRSIPYRRGKVTGGTSAINACGAQWGRAADFAAWVASGNPEWSWEHVRTSYSKLESDIGAAAESHGRTGPITISRYAYQEFVPIQRAFYDACCAAGLTAVHDHNEIDSVAADEAGGAGRVHRVGPVGPIRRVGRVGPWPMNRDGATRMSTALGYLEPARQRSNLTVRPSSLVDRVRFEHRHAVGVELADGTLIEATHILLCAGAIGSATILLRSGIGPASELRAPGIDVLQDTPGVGAKLWDHVAVPIYLRPKSGQCVPGRDPRFQVLATLTAEGSTEANDLQMVMTTHMDISGSPALLAAAGVPVVAVLRAALMVPKSHGRVGITSADPNAPPRIELNYATDPEDMRRLINATRFAWNLAHGEVLQRETEGVVLPTAEIAGSDNLLRAYIREHIGTYCHALGTAPMGPASAAGAVVDQHCHVHGLENLWVVDASVFPAVPRVVPNLTVMLLAERAAEWLRKL